jgi:hypothetical protein
MDYDVVNSDSAFPITDMNIHNGMTLRDYFAAQALPTIVGQFESYNQNFDYIARLSYNFADAMISARGRK